MITVVGIGPGGSSNYLFEAAKQVIDRADLIIGSSRQLEIVPVEKQAACVQLPRKLNDLEILLKEKPTESVVVLASGDPLTYGIGKWLRQRFSSDQLTILPGISSIHYLFNQLQLPMEDCLITSSHGKVPDFDLIFQLPKVALVTDKLIGPFQLAQAAVERDQEATFYIGENLSYPDERIRKFSAIDVPDEDYQMNVVVIVNER